MPKTIYVITESSGYEEEGYYLWDIRVIEAYEYLQDAQLALWFWCLDQLDHDVPVDWGDDFTYVNSEGFNILQEHLDRSIEEITIY